MPYKDQNIRRAKGRAYTAVYRAKKKAQDATRPVAPRFCSLCGVDISHKRSNAQFCCREHKRKMSDSKRDRTAEYQRNIHKRRAQALQRYHADVELSRKKQLQRQKQNLHLYAANQAKRRAAKLQRTPNWLTHDDIWLIQEIYDLAQIRTHKLGFAWHVDHIIPLQGQYVSGLHVPSNLQVIPGRDNIAKNNAFEVA